MQALCLSVQTAAGPAKKRCSIRVMKFPLYFAQTLLTSFQMNPVLWIHWIRHTNLLFCCVSGMWPRSLRTPNCQSRMKLGGHWGDEVAVFPWKQIHGHMGSY